MKTWKKIAIGGLSFGVMSVTFMPFEKAIHVEASRSYTKDALDSYNKAEPLVKEAEKTKKLDDIVKAYKAFAEVTRSVMLSDSVAYRENDKFDKLYSRVRKLVYDLPSGTKEKQIVAFSDYWLDRMFLNTTSFYGAHYKDFYDRNNVKSVDKKLEENLRKWQYIKFLPPTGDIPKSPDDIKPSDLGGNNTSGNDKGKTDIEIIDEAVKDSLPKPQKDPYKGGGSNGSGSGSGSGSKGSESVSDYPEGSGSTSYKKEGKIWYRVTTVKQEGKPTRVIKEKMSASESSFLETGKNSTSSSSDSSFIEPGSVDIVNYRAKFPTLSNEEYNYLTSDQNTESKMTLQYTLDKKAGKPYYFDTGLRVDKDNNVSFEQYKDVLYQVAVKSNGYVVEDGKKILIVIDGKPIVVRDIKKKYSEKEIESLFDSYPKIDIRVMPTRIGQTVSLEEKIVSKQAKTVRVNGKKVELEATPVVKDNKVLLPLKQVTDLLGGKVKQIGDTFVSTKKKDSIVYTLKSTKATVKGKVVDMMIAPEIKDGVLMVETTELAKTFGYEVFWDGDTSTIDFKKK